MQPKQHLTYGTIFTIAISLIFPKTTLFNLLILWLSTWLIIDLDHILTYIIKTKSINPKRFWKHSQQRRKQFNKISKQEKKQYETSPMILHSTEFLIMLILLGNISPTFYFISAGFFFHLILDYIDYYKRKINVLTKMSIIYTLITNKKKKEFIIE